eukprot:CAMPEP_0115284406 /NCGR_PEP_ID=MMETSP0270-20121206/60878_1 /TAXON_ID=71861 /ORGANISM="Scrippsiella trochoidea, Strain CCMP3099" /LENGTH=48 /DNA_ID= /DNA_START= /DNA_END= /DNA_ORIENTATION=
MPVAVSQTRSMMFVGPQVSKTPPFLSKLTAYAAKGLSAVPVVAFMPST